MEALAALAVTALLAALLLPILATTLTRWSGGVSRSTRLDAIMRAQIALQRELSTLAPLSAGGAPPRLWFRADESTILFARLSDRAGQPASLEAVSFQIERDAEGLALVRRFAPLTPAFPAFDPATLAFATPVLGHASAMRLSFLDWQGQPQATWQDRTDLPRTIELTITDRTRGNEAPRILSFSLPPMGSAPTPEER